jgi:hypothetical protein
MAVVPRRNNKTMEQPKKEKFYTLEQAKRILGVSTDVLYNYVKNGALERIIPPGKKQGVYKPSQVERLARELQTYIIHRKNRHTQFEKVRTIEEMKECLEINQVLFGVGRDLLEESMKTIEKNPEIHYMLKDEGQIIGHTALWPVKPNKLDNILAQVRPVKVPIEDLEKFESGKEISLYIVTIAITPGFNKEDKRFYGSRLVSGLIETIIHLGERGIPINTIAARTNTPDGIRLTKGIGFTEITPLTPERRTFVIDVEKSGIPFVQQYRKALENSRKYPKR